MQALQWVTFGSIVAYLGYNTGGMFVTGETTLAYLQLLASTVCCPGILAMARSAQEADESLCTLLLQVQGQPPTASTVANGTDDWAA